MACSLNFKASFIFRRHILQICDGRPSPRNICNNTVIISHYMVFYLSIKIKMLTLYKHAIEKRLSNLYTIPHFLNTMILIFFFDANKSYKFQIYLMVIRNLKKISTFAPYCKHSTDICQTRLQNCQYGLRP